MDPKSGWCEIRPYNSEVWKFLRAAFKSAYLLLSATMEELSLQRILGSINITLTTEIVYEIAFLWTFKKNSTIPFLKFCIPLETLEISRSSISVLYKNPDRPNIYSQRRLSKQAVDVTYIISLIIHLLLLPEIAF